MKKDFWLGIDNFKKSEFSCKCGCGHNPISEELVKDLQIARRISEVPFIINSACRCIKHNKSVDGSFSSSHLEGLAVDIKTINSSDRYKITSVLLFVGFTRIGVYRDFIHVDIDTSKADKVLWYK